jgi:tRNA-modifying protein YgfZ
LDIWLFYARRITPEEAPPRRWVGLRITPHSRRSDPGIAPIIATTPLGFGRLVRGLPCRAPTPNFNAMTQTAALTRRGVIEVAGEDRIAFLQGLVSNDVASVTDGRAVWAALLTPQGKWLADFFILSLGDLLILDCECAQVAMLLRRLMRFRLRSKVTAAQREDLAVYVAWNGPPPPVMLAAPDPRLPSAGWRLVTTSPIGTNATDTDWDCHRLALGLPDGSADLETEKTVLLEAGFDELSGVSWSKGCYMGQELTARTKYRGLIKRRLVPVTIDGPTPAAGTPVLREGIAVGTMRSGQPGLGLALLRLEALRYRLDCGAALLTPRLPGWLRLPEPAS